MEKVTLRPFKTPYGFWLYEWVERELDISRVNLAIGWPGAGPGFACCVAEEYRRVPTAGHPTCHVIAEVEEMETTELLRQCSEWSVKYNVANCYARRDPAFMHFVSLYNTEQRQRHEKEFFVQRAPYSDTDNLAYHLQVIQSRLNPDRKSLYFCEGSKLRSAIVSLTEDITTVKGESYPALSALSYALVALSNSPFVPDEDYDAQNDDDYDPLNYMNQED